MKFTKCFKWIMRSGCLQYLGTGFDNPESPVGPMSAYSYDLVGF